MSTATDTFTGADATLLTSHTADTGETWTLAPSMGTNDLKLSSNQLQAASAGFGADGCYCSFSPASADYTVSATLTATAAGSLSLGVIGRQSTSADTKLVFFWHGSDGLWELREIVAGSSTTIGSSATPNPEGSSGTIDLVLSGSNVTCKWNGSIVIGPVSTAISAAGKAGIMGSDTPSNKMDGWSVTDAGGLTTEYVAPVMEQHIGSVMIGRRYL